MYATARPSTTVHRSDATGLTEITQPGADDESSMVARLEDGRFVGVRASGRYWVGPPDDPAVTELPDIGFATPESAQVIGRAPDGKVWVGGHFAMTIHDTAAGTQQRFRVTGEPKTIDFAANGDAWIVMYPGVEVLKVTPDLTITSYGKVAGQYRPREAAWVEETQQLVVATRSSVGTFHGALSVVDATSRTIDTYPDLLPGQGIESVEVHDGVAWITGDTRPENQVGPAPYAEIGAFDLTARTMLWRDGLDEQNLSIENLHVLGDRIFVGCRRPSGRQLVLDRETRQIVAEHQVHGYGEISAHRRVAFIYSNFSDEIVALGGRGVDEPIVLHTGLASGWFNPPTLAFVPCAFQLWGMAGTDLALYDVDPRCRS